VAVDPEKNISLSQISLSPYNYYCPENPALGGTVAFVLGLPVSWSARAVRKVADLPSQEIRAHTSGDMGEIVRQPASTVRPSSEATRVVEYVRMSTEHQQYSTENQRKIIQQYAEGRGMDIVKTYTDAGKSGLRIDGRDALKELIRDVESGHADFNAILVYDVSRWGRFQDADESAYYEYICRRAKIDVHYCGEQFENDGSPISTIVKGVKRAMAGEYSRELSAKVFIGQCRLIELGFRQGGSPGFGLRRMLRDVSGQHKGILNRGEQKSIQTDRVILIPGPAEEVEIVRWIYRSFVEERIVESKIARMLNERGVTTDLGRAWTQGTVHQILTNEKYVGNNVYNRVSFKLKKKRVLNPPEMWIRSDAAFESVVPMDLFASAQTIIRERSRRYSNDELLDQLRSLLGHEGRLSGLLIDEANGMASSSVYRGRFGSLIRAYGLIGYVPERDYEFIETNRQLRLMHPKIIADVTDNIRQLGGAVNSDSATDLLVVNGEFTAALVIARCRQKDSGVFRWLIRLDTGLNPDITVAVRMSADNQSPLDYYLLPRLDMTFEKLLLAEDNAVSLDTYRFDTLDFFFGMARRARIPEAA
jgi:DNA invertase Pin-like site-specific DNA recombinase